MERTLKTIGIFNGIVGTIAAVCICGPVLRASICWSLLFFALFESTTITISAILIGVAKSLEKENNPKGT